MVIVCCPARFVDAALWLGASYFGEYTGRLNVLQRPSEKFQTAFPVA
ncbi:hypothetical protein [Neisseria animaloris]|nr:hypothetical protein [Neisseria animaloris]